MLDLSRKKDKYSEGRRKNKSRRERERERERERVFLFLIVDNSSFCARLMMDIFADMGRTKTPNM